ncbi:MAG: transposase [Terriglobia bacterium]|jgi:hypothetical protein
MEDAPALYAAQHCARRINTAREAVRLYGADHERIAIAALLRSTWEGRRSALRAAEKDDCSCVCLVRKYCPTAYLSRSRPQTAALRRGSTSGSLLIGYFKGNDSERGIAWRANDLLALRQFLRIGLEESGSDHSTIARAVRIDAATLEANAAPRSIVRWNIKKGYMKGKNSTRN